MRKIITSLTTLLLITVITSYYASFTISTLGQEISFPSSSSSGCPQIQTDCFGEPTGCKSEFGLYDPKTCMCICQNSTSTSKNDNCKCPSGQYAIGNMCSSTVHGDCFSEYKPVCGCDGITYGNACIASFLGIKKKTKGICNSLNPRPVACLSDGDCPPGKCPDGKTYQKYNCLENVCNELNFFSDPCLITSSGGSAQLNKNFAGVWKARIKKATSSSGSGAGECIICIQVVPDCLEGQILVPQNCTKCAHCVDSSSGSTGCAKPCGTLCCKPDESCKVDDPCMGNPACTSVPSFQCIPLESSSPNIFSTSKVSYHIDSEPLGSSIITLKLCIKDGQLKGVIHQGGVFISGKIISQDVISETEVDLTAESKNDKTAKIKLILTGDREFIGTFADGHEFIGKKLNSFRGCSVLKGETKDNV